MASSIESSSSASAVPDENWKECQKRSDIWRHLLVSVKDKGVSKCKHCGFIFKGHSSTTTLKYHLTHRHKIKFDQITSTAGSIEKVASQTSIKSHFSSTKSSSELVLARLTAIDGISFHTLANSQDIRKGWLAQGLQMPRSENGIQSVVMEYGKKARKDLSKSLEERKKNGERFAITFDEWTSIRNRRYVALNLHGLQGRVDCLGTVRIQGSLPAERACDLVKSKLKEFDLDLTTDIVGCTTDGASVMKKFGRLLPVEHQLCHCHGLHLAVSDVLYKKSERSNRIEDCDSDEEDTEDSEDADGESEDQEGIDRRFPSHWRDENAAEISEDFISVIAKIRTIVKLFRKSPMKNDLLTETCKKEYGKKLVLLADSRTRWNSMLTMVKRFLRVKSAVAKSLVDLDMMELLLGEEEMTTLKHLVEALDVIETASLALSRRDSDLKKAELIFDFVLQDLQRQDSPVARKLYEAVWRRIEERRKEDIAGLLWMLDDPENFCELTLKQGSLSLPSMNVVAKTARDLYLRLFKEIDMPENARPDTPGETEEEPAKNLSKREELDAFLTGQRSAGKKKTETSSPEMMLACIKKELAVLESTGERPRCLGKLYDALKCLPPSSTEAERSFSSAGIFVTKLRSRLSDDTIDTLCFLRSFLRKM